MNSNAIRMFLAAGTLCLFGSALPAQSNRTSFDVPFAFHVTGKAFAAGKYVVYAERSTVTSLKGTSASNTAYIVGSDTLADRPATPALVFHCYAGDTCFLAEIHAGDGRGTKIAMSKVEKEIARSERHREMATVAVGVRNAD